MSVEAGVLRLLEDRRALLSQRALLIHAAGDLAAAGTVEVAVEAVTGELEFLHELYQLLYLARVAAKLGADRSHEPPTLTSPERQDDLAGDHGTARA